MVDYIKQTDDGLSSNRGLHGLWYVYVLCVYVHMDGCCVCAHVVCMLCACVCVALNTYTIARDSWYRCNKEVHSDICDNI